MAKRQKNHKCSSLFRFFLCFLAVSLFLPCTVFAESLVLVRIYDEIDSADLSTLKDVKLAAALKTDKKGNMVVRCLNLFNIPVAKRPFNDSPVLQKLAERTQLKVDQKGKGVFIKLAIAF